MYNTKLTQDAFSGTYFSLFSKKLCDENEKVMGCIKGKKIKDLNNKIIASFQYKDKRRTSDGKNKKVAVYKSVEGEDVYRVEGKTLFLNGSKIGSAKPVFATLENLFVLSIIFLVLAVVATTVTALLPYKVKPVITIRNTDGEEWGANQVIKVFDKTLYPGTEGEYEFVVKNGNAATLECLVEFSRENTNVQGDYFPLEFQLLMNNQIVGGKEWQSIEDLSMNGLLLMPNSEQVFCLRWRWQFEQGKDAEDTFFAIENGKVSISINIQAQTA